MPQGGQKLTKSEIMKQKMGEQNSTPVQFKNREEALNALKYANEAQPQVVRYEENKKNEIKSSRMPPKVPSKGENIMNLAQKENKPSRLPPKPLATEKVNSRK